MISSGVILKKCKPTFVVLSRSPDTNLRLSVHHFKWRAHDNVASRDGTFDDQILFSYFQLCRFQFCLHWISPAHRLGRMPRSSGYSKYEVRSALDVGYVAAADRGGRLSLTSFNAQALVYPETYI